MPTEIKLKVNGVDYTRTVEPRKLLSDFIREYLELTGTHVGCEHGVCGACTILLDGRTARSCLIFAVQADGAEIVTVEGLAEGGELNRLQKAFWENHGLQCGFCTPGALLTATELLRENPNPSEDDIRETMSGILCRCTGYHHILESVKEAASGGESGS
jgi:aerobic-type carbon monoxide dehydrogenase small subunit (CoxS/CutS family)